MSRGDFEEASGPWFVWSTVRSRCANVSDDVENYNMRSRRIDIGIWCDVMGEYRGCHPRLMLVFSSLDAAGRTQAQPEPRA